MTVELIGILEDQFGLDQEAVERILLGESLASIAGSLRAELCRRDGLDPDDERTQRYAGEVSAFMRSLCRHLGDRHAGDGRVACALVEWAAVCPDYEAWDALQAHDYDLVIADWNMPRRTGAQLLADVRGAARGAEVPLVMLTARSDRDSIVEAARAGVTDYIVKPFGKQTLIEKIG